MDVNVLLLRHHMADKTAEVEAGEGDRDTEGAKAIANLVSNYIFQAQLRKALMKEVLDLCHCLQCPYVMLGDADDVGRARGIAFDRQQSHTELRCEGLTSTPAR